MDVTKEVGVTVGPRNKREARQWVRNHWATVIRNADMNWSEDEIASGDLVQAVWEDECRRIINRLSGRAALKETQHEG